MPLQRIRLTMPVKREDDRTKENALPVVSPRSRNRCRHH
jgi:hypothetical protein